MYYYNLIFMNILLTIHLKFYLNNSSFKKINIIKYTI